MRKLLKRATAISVVAMLLFSFCISVSAVEETNNSQDGLVASITTEKDSFQANEDIDLTFKVTNTNDFAVENVSLEAVLPENLKVKGNEKQIVNSLSLESGENITLNVVAVKEESATTNSDNTKATTASESNINKTTNSIAPNAQSATSVTEREATKSIALNAQSATSVTEYVSNIQNSTVNGGDSVKTGNNIPIFIIASICIVAILIIAILRNKNNAKKYLSMVLCFSIVLSVATVAVIPMVGAAETTGKSFTVSKKLNIAEMNSTIKGIVTYDFTVSDDENISRAEWADMLVREFSMNTDMGENKKVPYKDIENSKYKNSIMIAYYCGVLFSDVDKYDPEAFVTREFAAYTLNNCLGFVNNKDLVCDDSTDLKYPDASAAIIERGFLNLENNKFMPEKAVTRNELSNIIVLIKETLDKAKIDVNYDNTVKPKDNVISLDGTYVESINDNVVNLFLDDETSKLKEGDVFVTQNPDDSNETVAYKVSKVQILDEIVVLSVTKPEIYELYDKLDIQGTISFDTPKPKKSSRKVSRVSRGIFDFEPFDVQKTVKLDSSKLNFKNKILEIGEGANKISVTLNGGLEDPELNYKVYADFDWFTSNPLHIKDDYIFLVSLKNKLKFNGTAKVTAGLGKAGTIEIAKYPVRFCPTVGANICLNLVVKADGNISFEFALDNTVGALCDRNGLQFVKDFSKPKVDASATVEANAGIGVGIELVAGEEAVKVGAKVEIGAKAKLSVSLLKYKDGLLHGDLLTHLYTTSDLYIGGVLQEVLEEFNIPVKKEFKIFDEKNSPVKYGKHMEGVENITFMDKCTYRYVKGTVIDEKTSLPIKDARIEIYPKSLNDKPIATITTNDFGKFESLIKDVDGDFTFVISKDGYATSKKDVSASKIKRGEDTDIGEFKISASSSSENPDTNIIINGGDIVTFTGVLKLEDYEINSINKGTVCILDLDNPIKCYLNDGYNYDGKTEFNIDSVQINASGFKKYLGQHVNVKGEVILACTGHHRRDVVLIDPIIVGNSPNENPDGKCGDNLNWLLNNDGTLIISGYGDMYDFNNVTDIPWYNKRSEITSVELIDGLTSVGNSAFWNCSNLTKVDIPNSVISIGYSAFKDCYNLKWVTISDNAKKINDFAFEQCNNLRSVKIGYNVEEIGNSVFYGCNKIERIIIPYGVKKIGNLTFYGCENLWRVRIPSSVTEIGYYAFSHIGNSYGLHVYRDTYAYDYAINNKLSCSYGDEPEAVSICDNNINSEVRNNIVSLIKLKIGEGYRLKASAYPQKTCEDGTVSHPSTDFSWNIGNTDIASISTGYLSDTATVEAKSKGETLIYVKTSNGKTSICKIIVE